jgi:ketosteroid isomerase-like protein
MTNDIDQLLAVWTDAERAGDATTLDELLTDDFVGIGPVGFVVEKPTWLSRFEMGLRYDELTLQEVSVRQHGDASLVVARQLAVGRHGDTPTPPDTRLSFTVVAEAGGLRIAGMQYSVMGPPLGAPQ